MKGGKKKAGGAPKILGRERMARRNRELPAQTRKVLGRHYAAKYRVR